MAKLTVLLDKRESSKVEGDKYPLVMRVSHRGKNRYIPFDIHLKPDQYDTESGKITGIMNAVRKTNKVKKQYSESDIWLGDNKGKIKLWHVDKVKDEIEKRFFGKQSTLTLLGYSAKYLFRKKQEGNHSTATSYEDALKTFVKYQKKLVNEPDKIMIKTLFEQNKKSIKNGTSEGLVILEEYRKYDIAIKAISPELMKDFKAYLSQTRSRNTVGIVLRSINAILNDAGKSYEEIKGHEPLTDIKKGSHANAPKPLTLSEVDLFRKLELEEGTSPFHALNFFLFMFDNMGMNFFDIALLKVFQFSEGRIKYFRKKTEYEGDYFSIKQNDEALNILKYYMQNKSDREDYIFPILRKGLYEEQIFKVKNDKIRWFNKHIRRLAQQAGIEKDVTSYTPRDTWTNIGLDMGIDIRTISSGLGHSSVEVTNKHYGQSIQEKILDEINHRITTSPKP